MASIMVRICGSMTRAPVLAPANRMRVGVAAPFGPVAIWRKQLVVGPELRPSHRRLSSLVTKPEPDIREGRLRHIAKLQSSRAMLKYTNELTGTLPELIEIGDVPCDQERQSELDRVSSMQAAYLKLPVSMGSKLVVQEVMREMIGNSQGASSSDYFYGTYKSLRKDLKCPLPAAFLTLLNTKYELALYPEVLDVLEHIFFDASKKLETANERRLFYFHMIYQTIRALRTFKRDGLSPYRFNKPFIGTTIARLEGSAEDLIHTIQEGIEGTRDYKKGVRVIPDIIVSKHEFRSFFLANPRVSSSSWGVLPDGVAMDLFKIGVTDYTCSGRAIMGVIDKRELVLRAFSLGQSFLTGDLAQDQLFQASLLFYYKGSPNYLQYDQQPTHSKFTQWMKSYDWGPLSDLDMSQFQAVVGLSGHALADLFEQGKGAAYAAQKLLPAMRQSGMAPKTFLTLLTRVYQCHRTVLENALYDSDIKTHSPSVFLRDSDGNCILNDQEGLYVFSPENERDFRQLESYLCEGDIDGEAAYFVGWNGSTETFSKRFLEKGVKPSDSYVDTDCRAGIYLTPSVSVSESFALKAQYASDVAQDNPRINGVFIKYKYIDPQTGLPKGTIWLPVEQKDWSEESLRQPVVHNANIRDYSKVAEMRIDVNHPERPIPFTVKPCRISAPLRYEPYDYSGG